MNNALKKNTLVCLFILLVLVTLSACGSSSSSSTPTTVPNSAIIFYAHNLVFKNSSTVLSTGYNGFGQLGTGDLGNRSVPAGLDKYYPFRGFAAGGNHSVAFTNNSSVVYSWGYNGFGQLGNESTTYSSVPVRSGTITGVKAVAAGAFHTLALSDDTLWAWGSNDAGQLGVSENAPSGFSLSPAKVNAGGVIFSNISAIAANGKHSLALADGKVWAWGLNGSGQLGIDQTKTGALASPTVVSFGTYSSRKTAIAAGSSFNYAVAKNGTLLAWGNNENGQLGNGTTVSSFTPVQVMTAAGTPLQEVVQAAAGIQHGLARRSDGSVWAWGYNFFGQLGNNVKLEVNAKPDSPYAVQVLLGVSGVPLTGATDIRAFGSSSMAKIDGVWYVWGDNSFGQLGVSSLKVTVPEKMSGF